MVRKAINYLTNSKKFNLQLTKSPRLALYRSVYLSCRKLQLTHEDTEEILKCVLFFKNLQLDMAGLDKDDIEDINMYWPRCSVCNKLLKIDKLTGEDYCNDINCKNYRVVIKRV